MILGGYFHLAVSENSFLTILKATQVSKSAGIGNLSGCFLKDRAKPIIHIYVIFQSPINFLTLVG